MLQTDFLRDVIKALVDYQVYMEFTTPKWGKVKMDTRYIANCITICHNMNLDEIIANAIKMGRFYEILERP